MGEGGEGFLSQLWQKRQERLTNQKGSLPGGNNAPFLPEGCFDNGILSTVLLGMQSVTMPPIPPPRPAA